MQQREFSPAGWRQFRRMEPFCLTADTSLRLICAKPYRPASVEQGRKRVAREVHVFDDSLRGLAEGHYPWDLESEPNMMTNANIAKVEEVGTDRVLRLNYSGGEQTITIPTSAAVVAFDKAPADQLAAGRKVFVVMKKDGSEAAAVVIGAEGVKPPM